MKIVGKLVVVLLGMTFTPFIGGQVLGPLSGPTTIPNDQLDPARHAETKLESTIHTAPLPEEYIWTKVDAMPQRPQVFVEGWNRTGKDAELTNHYFRRSFNLEVVPEHATL